MCSEIAGRNRVSLATFQRTLESQYSIVLFLFKSLQVPGSATGIAIADRKKKHAVSVRYKNMIEPVDAGDLPFMIEGPIRITPEPDILGVRSTHRSSTCSFQLHFHEDIC